jgi:glutathionyl-hydroquinone reductase
MASKITDWVKPNDTSGEFKRQVSSFRSCISSAPDSPFPPEANRYHLYVSYACPWAHRTLITRKLKHLDDIISYSVVHWHLADGGWRFVSSENKDDAANVLNAALNVVPDPIKGHDKFTHLRDVYLESEPNYDARVTVPVLYDTKTNTIVSNESAEILRMLNSEFNALIADPSARALDLYPESLRGEIDAVEKWHYDDINNGVYKSGFATTQDAYEKNVATLFRALDRVEEHFSSSPSSQKLWFPGDTPTEVDVRLYVTMIRFDPVYVQHFKCNIRDVRSGYPRIHAWLRNLYWNYDAFGKGTTEFEHIKKHYTMSHKQINPHGIVPLGPVPDVLPLEGEVAAVVAAAAGKNKV